MKSPFNSDVEFLKKWYEFNKEYEEDEIWDDDSIPESKKETEIQKWRASWQNPTDNEYLEKYKKLLIEYDTYPDVLIVYRGIAVPTNIEFVKYINRTKNNFGTHWTLSKEVAERFARENRSKNNEELLVIMAKVKKECVNWEETILANTSLLYHDEDEIVIDNNENVSIVAVYSIDQQSNQKKQLIKIGENGKNINIVLINGKYFVSTINPIQKGKGSEYDKDTEYDKKMRSM